MKALKPILILCITICCFASCKKEVDMTLVQKTVLENADIRQIEVADAWQVTVIVDSTNFVELEYSAYLKNYIKAKMDGNRLEIGFNGSIYPAINSVFCATIHTSQIECIEADDAAILNFTGVFEGTQLAVKLNDASVCSSLVFTGNYCEIEVDGASKLLNFQYEGPVCKAALHDASQFIGQIHAREALHVTLEDASRFVNEGGSTAQADIKVRCGSQLNMVETQTHEMHVELSEASVATVWVDALLKCTLTEASTLYYKGNPEINVDCSDDSQLIPL